MSTYANYYYYAAAVATAIAGTLHILLFSNTIERNPMTGIFFLVGGLAQLFWTIPMVKKWKDLVLHRNRRDLSIDYNVLYY
jgi:hypothetical protein